MKSPNQFELAHAAEVCRRLVKYSADHCQLFVLDLHLLRGAADTIDEFIENEKLTFFKEIPNGNTETKKTSTPTPDSEADTWLPFRGCGYYDN